MDGADGYTSFIGVWVKGEKTRVDMTDPAEGTEIFLRDSEFDYLYYPDDAIAFQYNAGTQHNPAEYYSGFWWWWDFPQVEYGSGTIPEQVYPCGPPSCSITGPDTIAGQECSVLTRNYDGSTETYWFATTNEWLWKYEYSVGTDYSLTYEFTDIDLNPTISDDIFYFDWSALGVMVISL